MRPVNLIPPEERRGERGPTRTGPIPYVVVGLLVAVLAGVTALVLTGNQISERKDEVATLEREEAAVHARAERLAAYSQFRSVREQRVATVASLADSRFDWERVMRELSLVLPSNVWLVSLDAAAAGGSGGGGLTSSIAGPSLEISGCATGHEAVAGFVTALKDIDGVTRVGVEYSELPASQEGSGSTSGGSSGGSTTNCQTRKFISKFKVVVAFDAAPVPMTESSEAALPSATETAQTTSTETSESGG